MTRVAVDVGGTFTDLAVRRDSGALAFTKVHTTSSDPGMGVLRCIKAAEVEPTAVERLIHGTTVVINTIIERRGARTALVTTEGFADVLEIGRGNRPDMYDFRYRKPPPLVPRELCFEVRERLDADGQVLVPLDPASLEVVVEALARSQVEAVAVCTLHSYLNPRHEETVARTLRERLPEVVVSASHEVSRWWREYERVSTTVLNAYTSPPAVSYLAGLGEMLRGGGFGGRFVLVQSGGGLTDVGEAGLRPVVLLESGPVSGVAGFARLAGALGEGDIISFDVGGTTAKCAVVRNGRLPITDEYAIGRTPTSPGYPVQIPSVDVVEIGAGGGSLARATPEGAVRVGPESAGADPGPACYGWGGKEPTITDAALLAGWLDPGYFLGGRMPLQREESQRAVARLAEELSVSPEETAAGILRLAHEGMAGGLRLVSLERGHDPRDFMLGACGGAGPMHAALLAAQLGIPRVLVPPSPGTFSASSMLLLRPHADAFVTRVVGLEEIEGFEEIFEPLVGDAEARLPDAAVEVERVAGMRYRGQEHTLEVSLKAGATRSEAAAIFHEVHQARYGFRLAEGSVECVYFRVVTWGAADRSFLANHPPGEAGKPLSRRRVAFGEEVVDATEIYRREALGAEARLSGPAVVEEETSVTLVPPGASLEVDRMGNLVIEI